MQSTILSPDFIALLLGSQTILLTVIGFFLVRYIQSTATKADVAQLRAELELEMSEQCMEIMKEVRRDYQTQAFCDERSKHYSGGRQ